MHVWRRQRVRACLTWRPPICSLTAYRGLDNPRAHMQKIKIGVVLGLLGALVKPLNAQVPCSACADLQVEWNLNDTCTTSSALWTRSDPGDCALNPTCVPNKVCLFSVALGVVDNCGRVYGSQFCTYLVNAAGLPVGGAACAPLLAFPIPPGLLVISNYPVACGKRDEQRILRADPGGVTTTVAIIGGACAACTPPAGG